MLLYRALLYLFPRCWRAEYGGEMCGIFEARRRDSRGLFGLLLLWLQLIPDLVVSAVAVQWDIFSQDVRHTTRSLLRSPLFALTAIAAAGIGIGATTAVFTLADHVLIRPFAFSDEDRLVKLREDDLSGLDRFWDVSPANFRDWKRMSTSFESMGAYRGLAVNLSGDGGEPQHIEGASLTVEVFPILGVRPQLGRVFTEEDDRESAPGTVILSHRLWQERFGGDPGVLGEKIYLDREPYTIIGVMPASFYFPGRDELLWTPMRFGPEAFAERRNTYVFPLGRLKPGISIEQLRAEMRTVAAKLARAYPNELAQVGISAAPLREDISERTKLMLKVLVGAAVCVLLVACTNLANLMIARALTRRRELAVRAALGAGRERLVRQTLSESLMIATAGGALGLLIAKGSLPLLVRLVPISLPVAKIPAFDARVLLLAAIVTLVTALGFGVLPAIRMTAAGASELRTGTRSAGGQRTRLRSALVTVEIASSVLLIICFGLFMRALWRVQSVNAGFRTDHLVTMRTALPMPRYETPEAREPFFSRVLNEARRRPAVQAAGYTSFLPIVMGGGIWPVEIEGQPEDVANRRTASLRFITPGFLEAMGIPLLAGRDIRQSDSRPAPYIAIVSKSFVERYWPGVNPLGRAINIGNHRRIVIGIVGGIRVRGLEGSSEPQVYVSWQQSDDVSPWYAPKDLAVRTSGDPIALASDLRRVVHEADPEQPLSDIRTMTDIIHEQTAPRRTQLVVLGAFGAVALLLAGIGICAVLAFAVSSRTHEIGIRMALGARRADILAMTAGEGFRLALIGIAIGVAFGWAAGKLLVALLSGVNPWDPGALAAALALALAMTAAGTLPPALRSARVDPSVAMRAE